MDKDEWVVKNDPTVPTGPTPIDPISKDVIPINPSYDDYAMDPLYKVEDAKPTAKLTESDVEKLANEIANGDDKYRTRRVSFSPVVWDNRIEGFAYKKPLDIYLDGTFDSEQLMALALLLQELDRDGVCVDDYNDIIRKDDR